MIDSTGASDRVEIRAAALDDWPSVAEWVSQTWDWGDYVEQDVWQDWIRSINDDDSFFRVAADESGVLGFYRLAEIADAQWWLEGIRVRPQSRGSGLGTQLVTDALNTFSHHGGGKLRFLVEADNQPMQRIARKFGFRHRTSYRIMEAPARDGSLGNFRQLGPGTHEFIWQYLRASPLYRANKFLENSWTMRYITQDLLPKFIADPAYEFVGWREFDTLHGLAIISTNPTNEKSQETQLHLGYIDAPDDTTLEAMLTALQKLALHRGMESVSWKMPLGIGLDRATAEAGFEQTDQAELHLYEQSSTSDLGTRSNS